MVTPAPDHGKNDTNCLMSMLKYPIYDFLTIAPRCLTTTTLSMVLEIFAQEQCDRLVVVNQQQSPIGLLRSAHFTQKLLAVINENPTFNLQQPLLDWEPTIIEPVQTILQNEKVDKLLYSANYAHKSRKLHNYLTEWVLVDLDGKLLGLLDNSRLLKLLAREKKALVSSSPENSPADADAILNSRIEAEYQPLVHLLEKLPWPLMLQTEEGDVVTQNPAWWQQLGALKNPKEVSKQVESILAPAYFPASKFTQQNYNEYQVITHPAKQYQEQNNLYPENTPVPSTESKNHVNTSSSHCFLNAHLGTCTCVVQVQSGQEQIWQFAKIPLNSFDAEVTLETHKSGLNADKLWLILATDITEQQQLCKELAAKNADLMQLNRLKDEFLACISHELKTPLTAVLGLSRLLADQNLGELNERQARYAGLIHQSGRHLMCVVNNILDLTRMETGQIELTLTSVKIRTVCDRALAEVKGLNSQNSQTAKSTPSSADQSEPQFSLAIEPGLEQIVADELRLRQMLVHLLSNAFKFTIAPGEIGLRVNHWEGWIAFTVWDTGIGIPEHKQHLIFQKFQQLENPMTRQFEGTGLGLVLTRALARLHGGDVSFLSREGKGSQFTLLLPPAPPKPAFVEDIDSATRQSRKITQEFNFPLLYGLKTPLPHQPIFSQRLVLVVEAIAQYIEDLSEHLKNLGYRVVIARSGTEALEKARRLQPKAVFLNPLLPLLSGWDVLTLLKSDQATSHIPVIVTATAAEKEQAFANGTEGFLSLPIEPQMLTPLIDKLCATPEVTQVGLEDRTIKANQVVLRILRLVSPTLDTLNPHPSLSTHRVIEVDDLAQAEVLARVWQFDVVLLDMESSTAQNYLQKLVNYPRLIAIPLVTCDVATTLAASQISGLNVFPYITPSGKDNGSLSGKPSDLLSVLQIASGICSPPNVLVIDFTMLRDLPQVRLKQARNYRLVKNSSSNSPNSIKSDSGGYLGRGSEWFQALIQYLKTAGLKANMGRCWADVLQQIHHESIDLLLICFGDGAMHKEVQKALRKLTDLPLKLPPILLVDQRSHPSKDSEDKQVCRSNQQSLEKFIGTIAVRILPRSISMEELLNQINLALRDRK